MATVKHFVWTDYNNDGNLVSGRVAVRVDGDEIWFARIHGKAPYANMRAWWEALCAAFPEVAEGERYAREHLKRPWHIKPRYGMSKCVSYILRELVNEDLLDAPERARIDVSMNGKLRDFRMKLGYFHALAAFITDYTTDRRGDLCIIEKTPENRIWNPPYESEEE